MSTCHQRPRTQSRNYSRFKRPPILTQQKRRAARNSKKRDHSTPPRAIQSSKKSRRLLVSRKSKRKRSKPAENESLSALHLVIRKSYSLEKRTGKHMLRPTKQLLRLAQPRAHIPRWEPHTVTHYRRPSLSKRCSTTMRHFPSMGLLWSTKPAWPNSIRAVVLYGHTLSTAPTTSTSKTIVVAG